MPALGDGCYVNDTTSGKYLRICAGPQRGKYVHQLVAEALLGRELSAREQVDHKDQNTLNNDWRNLEVILLNEHTQRTNERRAQDRRERQRRRAERRAAKAKAAVEGAPF